MKIAVNALVLAFVSMIIAADAAAQTPASKTTPLASADHTSDWPQWRGPNRDGVAPTSPKLIDHWPKDGPPLVWKSDWIPACEEGGNGSPVVADGKVFLYANAKLPIGKAKPYQIITDELLLDAGWLPNLPDELAKKIEAAWADPQRPSSAGWAWWNPEVAKQAGELDAFLAKKPELAKYIKDFIATLKPDDAKKYADYVKLRLAIAPPKRQFRIPDGLSWQQLVALAGLRDKAIPTLREWMKELKKYKVDDSFVSIAFLRATTMADTIVCLDAATGKEFWRQNFPEDMAVTKDPGVQWWSFGIPSVANYSHCEIANFGIGVSATPAVWGGKCYIQGAMGLYCLSAGDGALVWQVKGEPENSSPLVADGVVYNVGKAYDAETGKLLWSSKFWDGKHKHYEWTARYSSPLLFISGGKRYVITTDFREEKTSSYCCLDLHTGEVMWKFKSPIGLLTVIGGDFLMAPPVYGGSGMKAYRMTPTEAKLLWKLPLNDSAGNIYQGHLYMPGNVYKCADISTGEFNWKQRLSGDASECSATVLADGKIFTTIGESHQLTKGFGDLTYSLSMIRATPEKYDELGRFNPRMCLMTSPAIVEGKMYLRLLDGIACYDLQEHGVYLDRVAVTRDQIEFQFQQAGGGLVAKDLASVQIAESGVPAKARIDGDRLVVEIKDTPLPFGVVYKGGDALVGKNGKPVPAFSWNDARLLKFRKGFDNTLVFGGNLPLPQNDSWKSPESFTVAGAKVTRVELDPEGKTVSLITDKTWQPGDAVALTYPSFAVDRGAPRREKLAATVVEPQRAAATFVKVDETTAGNWKGIYGAEGELICADKAAAAPQGLVATVMNKEDKIPWAPNKTDPRYLQFSGNSPLRTVSSWHAPEQFEIAVEITDGKEHQAALYCLAWNPKCDMTVEVLDADTKAVLDSQPVKDFVKGRYLVWNLKGQVVIRLTCNVQAEGCAALASGLFFDMPGGPGK